MGLRNWILAAALAVSVPFGAQASVVSGSIDTTGELSNDDFVFDFVGETAELFITPTADGAFEVNTLFEVVGVSHLVATFQFTPLGLLPDTNFVDTTFSFDGSSSNGVLIVALASSGAITDGDGVDLGFIAVSDTGDVPTGFTITGSATAAIGSALTVTVTAVPLPAGVALMLTGLAGLGVVARRRKAIAA